MCVYICIEICMCVSLSFTPYMYMYSNGVANHTFYHPHYLPKKKSSKNQLAIQVCLRRFSSLSHIFTLCLNICVSIYLYMCVYVRIPFFILPSSAVAQGNTFFFPKDST